MATIGTIATSEGQGRPHVWRNGIVQGRGSEATVKADISEEAWGTMNSTVSRPFPPPVTGKVAVKVINHYGDEVLKVYP